MGNGLSLSGGANYLAVSGTDRLQPDTAQGYYGFDVSGGTVTTSRPVYEASQTWNAGGVAFVGIQLNITNTASAAGSHLIELNVGGTARFHVDKTGTTTLEGVTSDIRLILSANDTQAKIISWRTTNLQRWAIRVDGAEAGANAGSDFHIRRYDDAGAVIDAPISITRSTGQIEFLSQVVGTGGTVTTSTPILDLTQTWNAGAVSFVGLRFRITDTASAATSRILDFLVGGASQFEVDKAGIVSAMGAEFYNGTIAASNYERFNVLWSGNVCTLKPEANGTGTARRADYLTNGVGGSESGLFGVGYSGGNFNGILSGGSVCVAFNGLSGFKLPNSAYVGWVSDGNALGSALDTGLFRNAAGVVEVNNGTSGQIRDMLLRNLTFQSGLLKTNRGADAASASTLQPDGSGNVYHVTGSTQINLIDISTSNVQSGTFLILIFDAAVTVKHNQAASGNGKPILLAGAADFSATANDTLMLVWDGSSWFEVSRTVI